MLREYKKKRDFDITPEPSGEPHKAKKESAKSRKALTFVIQKHSASHLHYDFRLEINGVMVSWAVPKGPSLDPAVKRLAMMTEDHPMEYSSFEGIIPEKQYGAGEVIIWDKGTYSPDEESELTWRDKELANKRMAIGLKKGKLSFTLKGKKVKGSWTLVKMHQNEKQWLLIKHHDKFASSSVDLTEQDASVVSGLTIADLEAGKAKKVWTRGGAEKLDKESALKSAKKKIAKGSKLSPHEKTKTERTQISNAQLRGLLKEAPAERGVKRISPMLATLADDPFSLEEWIFEPKLDGIRAIAVVKKGSVELSSRRGINLNAKYPKLVDELEKLSHALVLDGEIVALDENGRPSFQQLQQSGGNLKNFAQGEDSNLFYYVFDILHCDGKKLTELPFEKRRTVLLSVLPVGRYVKPVSTMGSDGVAAFEVCIKNGLEGVVGKRKTSLYESGKRSREWLKFKSNQSAEFVVCGFSAGTGARSKTFGSLVLGEFDSKGDLIYVGNVGTGFNDKSLQTILQVLEPLVTKKCALKNGKGVKGTWVQPKIVAEIKYMERTRDNMLRVPVFLHLREDIEPKSVHEEPGVHTNVASKHLKLIRKDGAPRRKA